MSHLPEAVELQSTGPHGIHDARVVYDAHLPWLTQREGCLKPKVAKAYPHMSCNPFDCAAVAFRLLYPVSSPGVCTDCHLPNPSISLVSRALRPAAGGLCESWPCA
jgi:hypothetical protein